MSNHRHRIERLEAAHRAPAPMSEGELTQRLEHYLAIFTTVLADGRTGFECVKANAERWPTEDNLRLAHLADLVLLAQARKAAHEQP